MKILAFAEIVHDPQTGQSRFKKVAFEVVGAAARLASDSGVSAIVIGKGVDKIAPELNGYGAGKVYIADDDRLAFYSTTAYSKILADAAESLAADVILLPASAMGKDLGARLAAKLRAGLAADCVAMAVKDSSIIATRPIYAGKALVDIKINSPKKVFTLRPNVFSREAIQTIRSRRAAHRRPLKESN